MLTRSAAGTYGERVAARRVVSSALSHYPLTVSTPRADRDRLAAGAMLALAGALVLEITYVLLFSPFVTDDGPLHVGSAAALLDSIGGSDPWGRFIEWNPLPAPSIVANLLLAGLLPLVGMEWAERLVVIGYVCGVPLATLYAVRAMRPGWSWLAFFALPLTFSYAFLTGFFNFSYSIVAFLVTAGFVLRSPVRMTNGRTAALSALLLLTLLLLTSSAMPRPSSSWLSCLACAPSSMRSCARVLARHGVVALLPSALLALVYVVTSNSAEPTGFTAPLRKLAGALTLEWGILTFDYSRGRLLPRCRRGARLSRSRGRCQEVAVARTGPGSARGRRIHAPRVAGGSGQPRHGGKWRRPSSHNVSSSSRRSACSSGSPDSG